MPGPHRGGERVGGLAEPRRGRPSYVVALAPGVDVDPWRIDPEGGDASFLPVPGLFTDTARVAGYAAIRSEDLVLQLRIMLDAIGHDGRLRIDPKAMVRLCAIGNAMLADVDGFGLPSVTTQRGWVDQVPPPDHL